MTETKSYSVIEYSYRGKGVSEDIRLSYQHETDSIILEDMFDGERVRITRDTWYKLQRAADSIFKGEGPCA